MVVPVVFDGAAVPDEEGAVGESTIAEVNLLVGGEVGVGVGLHDEVRVGFGWRVRGFEVGGRGGWGGGGWVEVGVRQREGGGVVG